MGIFQSSFTLGLLALAASVALLIWGMRNQGPGVGLARIFGAILVILSCLALIHSLYFSFILWNSGMGQRMSMGRTINSMPNEGSGIAPPSPMMNKPVPQNEQQMQGKDRPGPPERVRRHGQESHLLRQELSSVDASSVSPQQ